MPDHLYVYPGYLSKGLSRTAGRRVPSEAAVEEPTLEAILAAAKKLGFHAEAETEKQYPRRFFDYAGRVKIAKKKGVTKTQLLRLLAEEIRRQPPAPRPT